MTVTMTMMKQCSYSGDRFRASGSQMGEVALAVSMKQFLYLGVSELAEVI